MRRGTGRLQPEKKEVCTFFHHICASEEIQCVLLVPVKEVVQDVAHSRLHSIVNQTTKGALACSHTAFSGNRHSYAFHALHHTLQAATIDHSGVIPTRLDMQEALARGTSLCWHLPVRVKPLLRAPVPAYCLEMSSPWSAQIHLKRFSTYAEEQGSGHHFAGRAGLAAHHRVI